MSSILDSARIYNENKWEEKERRNLSEGEKNSFSKAEVRENDFGKSVCFHLKAKPGSVIFMPLSNESSRVVGEEVALDEIEVVTLKKVGEKDIERIMC